MPIIEPEREGGVARKAVWIGLAVVLVLGGALAARRLLSSGVEAHSPAAGSAGAIGHPAGSAAGASTPAQGGRPTSGDESLHTASTGDQGAPSPGGPADGAADAASRADRASGRNGGSGASDAARTGDSRNSRGTSSADLHALPGTRAAAGAAWPAGAAVPAPNLAGTDTFGGARGVRGDGSSTALPSPVLPPGTPGSTRAELTGRGTPPPDSSGTTSHTGSSDAHPDGTATHIAPAPADPASDVTPPVLQGIQFQPPQVSDGATAVAIFQVVDDLSGVKTITGSFRSPSGAAILPFEAVGDPSGTSFTANITIPARAETGAWYVATLYVLDRAGNSQLLSFTPQNVPGGSTLMVSSSESDSTPPTVSDITLEKGSVRDGEKDQIHIRADDDRSGVATIWGSFQSASRSALLGFSCQLDPQSGTWEGEIQVPTNADCGEWTLQQLRVTDKAGNLAILQGETAPVARVSFEVVGRTDCDSSAPTLEAFEISPSSLSNETGGDVVVTATVHDIGSGTNSVVGWLSGPANGAGQAPKLQFSCQKTGNDQDAPWVGRLALPRFTAKGIWRVALLRLFDNAHNMRDYTQSDAALAGATLEVQ